MKKGKRVQQQKNAWKYNLIFVDLTKYKVDQKIYSEQYVKDLAELIYKKILLKIIK